MSYPRDIDQLLAASAAMLRTQQAIIDDLQQEKIAAARRRRADRVANGLVVGGHMDTASAEDYAEIISSSDRDLGVIEDFVSRTGQNIGLGEPLRKVAGHDVPSNGPDVLTSFLLSSDFVS